MRAHMRRAVQDRLFERAAAAIVNILLGKTLLDRRYFCDGFAEATMRAASLQKTGFVEMDMRFDKPRKHQTAVRVFRTRIAGEVRFDRRDLFA